MLCAWDRTGGMACSAPQERRKAGSCEGLF